MENFNSSHKSDGPYLEHSTNNLYQLLFCDNPDLYQAGVDDAGQCPWNVIFDDHSTETEIRSVLEDTNVETRIKNLAQNRLSSSNIKLAYKELLAIIVEIGLDSGLDVLAAYRDGSARYINHTGKILIWDARDTTSDQLMADFFSEGEKIVNKIGPWDKPRLPCPPTGKVRISFIVSDGLYFGEGPIQVLFNDPIAAQALTCATQIMQYITQKAMVS